MRGAGLAGPDLASGAGNVTTTHETKAARLMVLYRLRLEGQLSGLSDVDLAAAFKTRRETIWKDRQALKRADKLYQEVMARQPWADKPGLTVAEAAAVLGCDLGTVSGLIRGGLVNARKISGRWRIPAAEVERLKR
jgi:excisionase family DNA binding protein